jgi:hypothetical protein
MIADKLFSEVSRADTRPIPDFLALNLTNHSWHRNWHMSKQKKGWSKEIRWNLNRRSKILQFFDGFLLVYKALLDQFIWQWDRTNSMYLDSLFSRNGPLEAKLYKHKSSNYIVIHNIPKIASACESFLSIFTYNVSMDTLCIFSSCVY